MEKVKQYAFSAVLDTTYDDAVARTKAAQDRGGRGWGYGHGPGMMGWGAATWAQVTRAGAG